MTRSAPAPFRTCSHSHSAPAWVTLGLALVLACGSEEPGAADTSAPSATDDTAGSGDDGGSGHDGGDGPVTNGTCVPHGEAFSDTYDCALVDGPSGDDSIGPTAHAEEDPTALDDPDLPWVLDELRACSCSCCHQVTGEAAFVWAWDFSPVWTDSIESDRLERLANGEISGSAGLPPEVNHGFSRDPLGLPTTDAERMQAYLLREVERREAGAE